jgi:hypothetical protein
MGALQSQLPPEHRLSQEWRQARQLLAGNPRGTTEDPRENLKILNDSFSCPLWFRTLLQASWVLI